VDKAFRGQMDLALLGRQNHARFQSCFAFVKVPAPPVHGTFQIAAIVSY
jgi:hypothetical protein